MQVNSVQCPCCKKELYRTVTNSEGIREMAKGSSRMEQDNNGPFMVCQHCSKRVLLESVPTPQGSPVQWRLSSTQSCL